MSVGASDSIDFSILDVSHADVEASRASAPEWLRKRTRMRRAESFVSLFFVGTITLVVALFFIGTVTVPLWGHFISTYPIGLGPWIFLVGLLGGALALLAPWSMQRLTLAARRAFPWRRWAALDRFARYSGGTFDLDTRIGWPSWSLLVRIEELLSLPIGGGAWIGQAELPAENVATGLGERTFLSVRLETAVPHFVLRAPKRRRSLRWVNELPFEEAQRISLEGDFDRHFQVYAPKGYDADIRYVFTPDFMAFCIDHLGGWDIELIDLELRCLAPSRLHLEQPAVLRSVIDLARALSTYSIRRTDRYVDARSIWSGTVAPAGQRLRMRLPSLLWIGAGVLLGGFTFIFMLILMIRPIG
ncbi:MAG: hypothetical protein J7480_00550 [Microbacteriaceae bacterium]|nr:hypothetical protein [Microbacteriaceae bacterium]